MGFQDSAWNICTSSLIILAASVFEISCEETDRQTNGGKTKPRYCRQRRGNNLSQLLITV